jgi:hypothetical protein
LKYLIRSIAPNYSFNENTEKDFLSSLNSLYKNLQPIFSKYIKNVQSPKLGKSKDQTKINLIKNLKENDVVLISASSSKKKLKNIGVATKNLIITGGPLTIDDYKTINPNISEKSLQGIKNKCKRLRNQILSEKWESKNLIFIYERDSITDKLILNSLKEISQLIGKNPDLIELNSWNDLEG